MKSVPSLFPSSLLVCVLAGLRATTINGEPTPSVSVYPSSTPSASNYPTSSAYPTPHCYTDLDELREDDLAVSDTSIPRTYVLCPQTTFIMGRNNENGPGYVGGFAPLTPRPNAVYQCGYDGKSSNNCVLVDGTFQLVSFGISFSEEQVNVVYKGITFQSGFQGSMLFANPGDITFQDCIIRDHQNIGAVISLFDSRFVRRRYQRHRHRAMGEIHADGERSEHEMNVRRFTKMIVEGEYNSDDVLRMFHGDDAIENGEEAEIHSDIASHSGATSDPRGALRGIEGKRILQTWIVDTPIVTSELRFVDCLFENNKGVPLDGQVVRPGIVTSQFYENELVFKNTVFKDNDFGRISVQPTGWAISTGGPLTISNTCFIDNNFRREAPVLVFDGAPITSSGNYGTVDDDIACQFIVQFPDSTSMEALRGFTCIEYEESSCQATVHQ